MQLQGWDELGLRCSQLTVRAEGQLTLMLKLTHRTLEEAREWNGGLPVSSSSLSRLTDGLLRWVSARSLHAVKLTGAWEGGSLESGQYLRS